jgi:hypothetical protein
MGFISAHAGDSENGATAARDLNLVKHLIEVSLASRAAEGGFQGFAGIGIPPNCGNDDNCGILFSFCKFIHICNP